MIENSEKKYIPVCLMYILMFFVLSYTFQTFFKNPIFKLPIILFVTGFFFIYVRYFSVRLFVASGLLSLIILIQGIMFDYSLTSHTTSLFMTIFAPFVFLKLFPINYHRYIINIITFLSCTSLFCWILVIVFPSLGGLAKEMAYALSRENPTDNGHYKQLIFFTYEPAKMWGISRNAGFCHEPGAFAVALIYGLVFNSILTKSYVNLKNILFVICLLTTFSTAGYLALFIFLLNLGLKITNIYTKALVVLLLLSLSFYSFYSIDFLSDKIGTQYKIQANKSMESYTTGRFLGMRKSLYVLSKYPLTGRGFNVVSQPKDRTDPEAAGYGFMQYLSQVGIVMFLLTGFLFYRTIWFWNNIYTPKDKVIFKFLPLVVVLSAQTFIPSLLFGLIIFETYFRKYRIGLPLVEICNDEK